MLLWLTVTTTIRTVESYSLVLLVAKFFRWSSDPDFKRSGHPVLNCKLCANFLSKTGDYLNKFYADIQWLLLLVFVSKVYYLLRKNCFYLVIRSFKKETELKKKKK